MKVDPNEAEAVLEGLVQDYLDGTYLGNDIQQAYQAAKISQIYLLKALLIATGYDEALIARVRDLWLNNLGNVVKDGQNKELMRRMQMETSVLDAAWMFLGMHPPTEQ